MRMSALPCGRERPLTEHARTGPSLVVVSRPLIKPDRRLSEQERVKRAENLRRANLLFDAISESSSAGQGGW